MPKSFLLSDEMYAYIERTWVNEPPLLARLREETAQMSESGMQIGADQGQFLSQIIKLIGARRVLEIGVFTGYSSTVTALALPADGTLIACDISEEFTAIARRYWAEAGVAHKIELRIAPALESLTKIAAEGHCFDFCFIDADKPNYANYLDAVIPLMRANGLIAIDNVLWHGAILDETDQSESTVALREFNDRVGRDPRVEICLAPVGDGMTFARVR